MRTIDEDGRSTMKIWQRPVPTTLFLGLICGVSTIPLVLIFNLLTGDRPAFYLTLWLQVTIYGILLMRWYHKSVLLTAFPLMILFWAAFWIDATISYFLLASAILGWIRSGICFAEYPVGRFGVEAAISLGTCISVVWFPPSSALSWAMAIWMFFLIQALFFVFFGTVERNSQEKIEIDPFEQARIKAEEIIAG